MTTSLMSDVSLHSDRLLARIRQELDKLPLSEEQKAKAIPRISQSMRFLNTRTATHNPGKLCDDSTRQGLTTRDYLQAALRHAWHPAASRLPVPCSQQNNCCLM